MDITELNSVDPTETIFDEIGETKKDQIDYNADDSYTGRILGLIRDARDYNYSYRSRYRADAAKLYQGMEPALDEAGRSSIVMTEVRDVVLAIMPSLMRIFMARNNVVEFVPNHPSAADMAAEATDYVRYVFMEDNPGFMITHDTIKDALMKGEGFVKWWTDTSHEISQLRFNSITDEQVAYILAEYPDDAEVVSQEPVPNPEGGVLYNMEIRFKKSKPFTRIVTIPPEEGRIDRLAKNYNNATLIGHERMERLSEVVKYGYTLEELQQYGGNRSAFLEWNQELTIRNPAITDSMTGADVDTRISFGEYWIRADSDGDGIDELHYIHTMGHNDIIMRDVIVDSVNMAGFCPDPEPHTTWGHSISELVEDLQKIKTNIMRNSLDSLAQTIFPRLKVNQTLANIDDVLNTELGAPIRVRDMGAVEALVNPFVGDAPLKFVEYLDMVASKRTGVSEASKGLDPKALQSTTVKGVDMVISGAQERIELIARILAETGFKDLYKGLLREVTRSPNPSRTIKVRGNWVEVKPSLYDPSMSVTVNPAIGRGSDNDRIAILMQVKATQEQMMTTLGITNPIVSPVEYVNTWSDIMGLAGFKNVERYFKVPTPDQMQALAAPKPDPALIVAQNETEKTRASAVKNVADNDYKHKKLELDDEFRKQKLAVDALVKQQASGAQIDQQHMQNVFQAFENAVDRRHEHMMKMHDTTQSMMENDSGSEDEGTEDSGRGGGAGTVE
jgi:hypothetical protein